MTVETATVDNSTIEPAAGVEVLPPVDSTTAALATVQRQLAEQTHLLRNLTQEVAALRAAQATYSDTVVKLEKQLRWARWTRRIRTALIALFWLGVLVILAYYWTDLATIWNNWATFLLNL